MSDNSGGLPDEEYGTQQQKMKIIFTYFPHFFACDSGWVRHCFVLRDTKSERVENHQAKWPQSTRLVDLLQE